MYARGTLPHRSTVTVDGSVNGLTGSGHSRADRPCDILRHAAVVHERRSVLGVDCERDAVRRLREGDPLLPEEVGVRLPTRGVDSGHVDEPDQRVGDRALATPLITSPPRLWPTSTTGSRWACTTSAADSAHIGSVTSAEPHTLRSSPIAGRSGAATGVPVFEQRDHLLPAPPPVQCPVDQNERRHCGSSRASRMAQHSVSP